MATSSAKPELKIGNDSIETEVDDDTEVPDAVESVLGYLLDGLRDKVIQL
jgi:hypothetical protein